MENDHLAKNFKLTALQHKALFSPTTLNEVAGCLPAVGKKTTQEMNIAISQKLKREWHDHH